MSAMENTQTALRVDFPITIPTVRGYDLVGRLGIATKVLQSEDFLKSTPQPLVLILHGLCNDKYSATIKGVEEALPLSISTFCFDFAGHGESGGETSYSDYPQQVSDVQDVLSYFKNTQFCITATQSPSIEVFHRNDDSLPLRKDQILMIFDSKILIGHSKGGTVSMLYSSDPTISPVPYVINISGRYNLTEKSLHRFTPLQHEQIKSQEKVLWRNIPSSKDQKRPVWVSQSDFDWRDQFKTSVYDNIPRNQNIQAVLTIHGNADSVVPFADAQSFDAICSPSSKHTLKSIENGSHQFLKPGEMEQVGRAINSWLDEHCIFRKALL